MITWRETEKGYRLSSRRGTITVFWDYRRQSWKVVYDDEFTGPFPNLDAALRAAEDMFGVLSGEADRKFCRDVDPRYRHLRSADVPARPTVEEFARGQAQRDQQRRASAALGALHAAIRAGAKTSAVGAPAAPARPAWADALGLGAAPWTLATVRAVYLKLAMEHHPDRNGDPERMAAINRAWEEAQRALAATQGTQP